MAFTQLLLGVCATVLALAACAPLPGNEARLRIAPSDQPVELLPLDELLAQADGGLANDATAAALTARAARLRAEVGAN